MVVAGRDGADDGADAAGCSLVVCTAPDAHVVAALVLRHVHQQDHDLPPEYRKDHWTSRTHSDKKAIRTTPDEAR